MRPAMVFSFFPACPVLQGMAGLFFRRPYQAFPQQLVFDLLACAMDLADPIQLVARRLLVAKGILGVGEHPVPLVIRLGRKALAVGIPSV